MYRGTTPVIILNIKNEHFDMDNIKLCHVTIESENGLNKIVYENPTIVAEDKRIMVQMTQEETLKFDVGFIKIQMKIKLQNDSVISSQIVRTRLNEILEEEVI